MYFPANMSFDENDVIDLTPINVTTNSFTIRWKEGTAVDQRAAPYIGYYIYYKESSNSTWTKCCDVEYNAVDEWQHGTVGGLVPDTLYQVYISVYRVDENGEIHEHTESASYVVQQNITFNTGFQIGEL